MRLALWPSNDAPVFHVVLVHFDGSEPAALGECFSQGDYVLPIASEASGSELQDVSHRHHGLGPAIDDEIQKLFSWGRRSVIGRRNDRSQQWPSRYFRLLLFFFRSELSLSQPLKQARHCCRPFVL